MHILSRLERGYMQLTKPEVWQDNVATALEYAVFFTTDGRLSDALVWAEQAVKLLEAEKAKVNT